MSKELRKSYKQPRLYGIWFHMKGRCYNQNHRAYKNYGARGITVCEEWRLSYDNFKVWASCNGYQEDLTLERLDVNGPYSPENCTWILKKYQNRNKRNTKYVNIFGERLNLAEACTRYSKVPYVTVKSRLRKGWSDEYAVLLPSITDCRNLNIKQGFREYTIFGETAILPVHIKKYAKVDSHTVFSRMDKGWHVLNALFLPKINGKVRGRFVKENFNPKINPLEVYGKGA